MADKGKNRERAARTERRAEALRENLRRRKLQARRRGTAAKAAPGRPAEQSGPETDKR